MPSCDETQSAELASTSSAISGLPEHLIESAIGYARKSRADSTLAAYDKDLKHFAAWCAQEGVSDFPAALATVAAYLAAHATTHTASTLQRRIAAISVRHQLAGYRDDELPTRSPEVKTVMAGIRRIHGVAPEKVKAARTKAINALVAPLGTKPSASRP